MPKLNRVPIPLTDEWPIIQSRCLWPDQVAYELIRPVVLFGRTAPIRAQETGVPSRTIYRKADRFEAEGMVSLLAAASPPQAEDQRTLPQPMRQAIVALKAQYPAFRPNEIATICFVQFGRRPSRRTVQRVLAEEPPPLHIERRFPPYHEIDNPIQRRLAVVRLHADGWNIKTIAAYLETSRQTVYSTLRRWMEDDFRGLEDKSHAPHKRVRKVDLRTMNLVRKLQENPELGEWRIHAALKQLGIRLSPRTCGRILAINRKLYGLAGPKPIPHEPREHPYKAQRRHQYWTVDVRYIEDHQLGDKPLYVISILENFSRAVLASAISRSQDLTAYLIVLYAAIQRHGSPEVLVSDGGAIFKAQQAQAIYRALEIRKEQIAKRQPWQSLIETQFNVQRRMADFHFAQARSWEEIQAVHARWVEDFNFQPHWAHRERQDDRQSPAEVLGWVRGTLRDAEDLDQIFYRVRFNRLVKIIRYT